MKLAPSLGLTTLLLALASVGCVHNADTSTDAFDNAGVVPTPEYLASHAAGPATAPTPMQPGVIYSPLREGTWTYRRVDPKQDGTTITQVLSRAEGDQRANWRRADGASGQLRHLAGQGDGNVYMLAIEDDGRGVHTIFAEPIPVMLTTMQPTVPITTTCDVKAVKASDPDKTMDTGTCTVTLTHIADQRLNLPAGTFDTKLVKLELKTSMKYVSIASESLLYYAAGVGMVAEDYVERGRAVIFPWHKQRTLVLTDYPASNN